MKKSLLKTGFLLLTFLFSGLLLFSTPILAKSYSIVGDRISIQVNRDKSIEVNEELTYDFDGSFSWAEMWIQTKINRQGNTYNTQVTDFSIEAADGSFVSLTSQSQTEDKFYAKWSYSAFNEQKTFLINYQLLNAVRKYPEVAELYWQVIGEDWQVPHQNVDVTVTLPSAATNKEDLLVYGHGPLNGVSSIVDNRTARFTAENVASGQFIEIRFIFPSNIVSHAIDGDLIAQQIKDEEANYVSDTIAAAIRAKFLGYLVLVGPSLFILGVLGYIIWWIAMWKRYGKEYQVSDVPKYIRELPTDLTPAEVDVLLKQDQEPSVNAFTATIFDLARKGYLSVEDEVVQKTGLLRTRQEFKTTFKLDRSHVLLADRKTTAFEEDVLKLIFSTIGTAPANFLDTFFNKEATKENKTDNRVTISEIKSWFKTHPKEFQKWFIDWQKQVKKEVEKHDFLEDESEVMYKKNLTVLIILSAIGFFAVGPFVAIFFILGIFLSQLMKRWHRYWTREVAEWNAFKKFLEHFADFKFKDLPAEAYKLWEHYLVFGILFGNADKIIKMLPIILENPAAVHPGWYHTTSGRPLAISSSDMTQSISSLSKSLNVMTSELRTASTSAAHYSSGSGGGFSGGGGGGGSGGGGGGGAG